MAFSSPDEIEGLTKLEVLLKIADTDQITKVDQVIFNFILSTIRPDALVKKGLVHYPNSKPISLQEAACELLALIEDLAQKSILE